MEDSRASSLLHSAFETLHLPTTATLADVKQAQRTLAKKLHPDLHDQRDAGSELALVNEAVRILELALTPDVEHAARSVGQSASTSNQDKPATPSGANASNNGVTFQLSGSLEGVFDAVLVAASWQGDPYEADPPHEFELMIHEPFSASGHVQCAATDRRVVEVTVTIAPRLSSTVPNIGHFVNELREQAQSLLDES